MTEETQTGQQADSDYAEAWRPTAGDKITGAVVDVKMIDPNGNGAYPCVTLATADGEKAVHAFHSVLRRELARSAPKIGDEVTLAYLGERPGGKNGTYHSYQVRGARGREFDWSSELPPEERVSSAVPIEPAPVRMAPEEAEAARRQQAEEAQRQTKAAAEKNFGSEVPF